MTPEQARFIINAKFNFGDGEWWHQSNCGTYLRLFETLNAVFTAQDALDVLESAFGAAANEYGD